MANRTVSDTIIDLEIIRMALCAYKSTHMKKCDCKFGVHHVYKDHVGRKTHNPRLPRGENGCGCPELYDASFYLKNYQTLLNDE